MNFFEKIKNKIVETGSDLITNEQALFIKEGEIETLLLYRKSELRGDSVNFINSNHKITPEQLYFFNKIFSSTTIAKTELTRFIIETIT